jgi:hypothetical protein
MKDEHAQFLGFIPATCDRYLDHFGEERTALAQRRRANSSAWPDIVTRFFTAIR